MHFQRCASFFQDFREKNSDLVRPEIVSTLKKSSMAFVRELMGKCVCQELFYVAFASEKVPAGHPATDR